MRDAPTAAESLDWSTRSAYWLAEASQPQPRRRRERETNPLFLTGHGLSIRVDKSCLLIKDGNTHFPSDRREWRFFKGGLDIPPVIVVVDGSGEITMDALDWLGTQSVSVIRLKWDGEFVSVVTTGGQAASSQKIRWQEITRDDPERRVAFAINLIAEKARAVVDTIHDYLPRSGSWERIYQNTKTRARFLEQRPPRSIKKLLGIEGAIASDYFLGWSELHMKWRALKQHPIPDDWYRYKSRAALTEGLKRNVHATHPINAMLNYAYGVLAVRMQIRLIAEGYDPRIGIYHDKIFHRGTYPALVLDFMEPMRPILDRAVLQLVRNETFSGADFLIQDDGSCRLNPELARRVAQMATDYYRTAAELANEPMA